MTSRHWMVCVPALIVASGILSSVQAQKYETADGCDEGRLREWESIIIGFEGDPAEQADARSVRDENLRLCAEWKAGRMTSADIERRYNEAVDAWVKRMDRRKMERAPVPAAG